MQIGDYFGKRPVVLAFVYYGCPMLCLQSLSSLASTLGVLSENPGEDFEVVSISIDPRETPAMALEKKAHYVERSGKPSIASGWHYLTGTEANIRRLTKAAGFRYVWDETSPAIRAPGRHRHRHAARQSLALPVRDRLRPARSAAGGARCLARRRSARRSQKALLYCYHYDLATGRYSLAIMRIVQLAGAATVFSLGTLIFVWTRRERRQVG